MASFKKKIINALFTLLLLIILVISFLVTPWGRPVGKTILLVPEVIPDFPIRPLKFFSREPTIEEVTLKVGDKDIKADLYKPNDNKTHPAIILTLGVVVTRKDKVITNFAQTISRLGFIVLVPDLPDFLSGFVWTDSVETMVSSVEYLEEQDFVLQDKIGFAGFCVGASASIVAAEDEKIADKVAFIAAISPYYDLVKRQSENEEGKLEMWEPAQLSVDSVRKGFINYVPDDEEKKTLENHFYNNLPLVDEDIEKLSYEGKQIRKFLEYSENKDSRNIWDGFPQEGMNLLNQLSPKNRIDQLEAKLFILSDKQDTFVPRIEGNKFKENVTKDKFYFIEVDSFEHVNPSTNLKRWSVLKQLFYLSRYLYNVLSEAY